MSATASQLQHCTSTFIWSPTLPLCSLDTWIALRITPLLYSVAHALPRLQEHFYLEPNAAIVIPGENDEYLAYSSTQVGPRCRQPRDDSSTVVENSWQDAPTLEVGPSTQGQPPHPRNARWHVLQLATDQCPPPPLTDTRAVP